MSKHLWNHEEAVAAGRKAQQVLRAKKIREAIHLGDLGETKVFVGHTFSPPPGLDLSTREENAEIRKAKFRRDMKRRNKRIYALEQIALWVMSILAAIVWGYDIGHILILIFK